MELCDAINKAVDSFGKDILAEERFVNILADFYHDRSKPAVLAIMKSIVKEGVASNLLLSNKTSIKNDVAKYVDLLSVKYGYDKKLTQNILFSLAYGLGIIDSSYTKTRINPTTPTELKNKNTPNSLPTNKQHNTNNKKQSNNTSNNSSNKQIVKMNFKLFFLLLLGHTSLFFSPATYLFLTYDNQWWPFFSIIPIAFLHLFSILMIGTYVDDEIPRRVVSPRFGGHYLGLTIFTCLFWIICPIVLGFNLIKPITYYYGFWSMEGPETPSLLSISLCFICAIISLVASADPIDFSGSNIDISTSFRNDVRELWKNKPFRIGFLYTCTFFLISVILLLSLPWIHKEFINYKIRESNKYNEMVRINRSQKDQDLSFMDFKLGSHIDSCINSIRNSPKYTIVNKKETIEGDQLTGLTVNDNNYAILSDNVKYIETRWDNQQIMINLYCLEDSVVGISFKTSIEIDSLLSLFSQKYGSPEFKLKEIEDNTHSLKRYSMYMYGNYLTPNTYLWTFRNSIIEIKYNGLFDYFYKHENSITYFDRKCEILLEEKQRKDEAIRQAIEKRYQDSIQHVEQLKKQQLEEERKQREKNHQESINGI